MIAHIDGGSRGNPGPAGYGVRVSQPDGTVVAEFGEAIGVATNNVAEYQGLLAALRYAVDHGYADLTVRSDSLLLVCQMRGEYRVKNPGLTILHAEARRLVAELARVRFVHVRREQNADADRLANEAMDEQEKTEGRRQKTESERTKRDAGSPDPRTRT
jgi:probable phosphoglycerate mutase